MSPVGDAPLIFCSTLTDPTVVRAFSFDVNTAKCNVYWEKVFTEYVESISPTSHGQLALGLYSGATAVVSILNTNNATPAPGTGSEAGGHGLSGGVVAAIVILVLLAVSVTVGGIYLIRRRNVRRSALNETGAAGLQYTTNDNSGYGAIS